MTMMYDQSIVNEYRTKAITSLDQLQIGKTYYGNYEGEVTLLGFDNSDNVSTKLLFNDDKYTYAHDSNIGASYNPWLLFDNKETCEEYKKKLTITYEPDDWDNWFSYD